MRRPEQEIQRVVVRHLQVRGVKNLLFLHIPNGGWRSKTEAAILQSLGVRAGASDLILLCDSKFYALELKSPKGRTTPAQTDFINAVRNAGGTGEVAHGIDEAIKILESWKLLRGEMQ